MPYKNFILENSKVTAYTGIDIENALEYDKDVKPDCYWDGITIPFDDYYFNTALATEVLEHCPDPKITLSETYRVLKQGGYFLFTVPFLWNLHEIPHDEYRFTPYALERLLREAGFSEIQITPHGGWHASLAQMMGLWVRRAPLTPIKKKSSFDFVQTYYRLFAQKG